MIRPEIHELAELGSFPSSRQADFGLLRRQQELLQAVKAPISDPEARLLIKLFGPDDYYGLAWTVLHLVEGAPHWPLEDCLADLTNEWIGRLRKRLENGGKRVRN